MRARTFSLLMLHTFLSHFCLFFMSVYAYVFVIGTICLGSPASFSSILLKDSEYIQQLDGNNNLYNFHKPATLKSSSNYNFTRMTDSWAILIQFHANFNLLFEND